MNRDDHDRAKNLLRVALVEGIPPQDAGWLDAHLAVCGKCAKEAAAWEAAIGSLRTFSVAVSPHVVRRTSLAVRRRAVQLQQEREQAAPVWIAAALSVGLTILTTPYAWSAFERMGRAMSVSDAVWQTAFLMWWFVPGAILGAAAVWRNVRAAEMQTDWRSL